MAYRVVTAPTDEPITVEDARLHIRLGDDETAEDSIIQRCITAAREFAEHSCEKALAPQTLEMALDGFPACDGEILLEMPPVASVTSITYRDAADATQTLDAASYRLSAYGSRRRVTLKTGYSWPVTDTAPESVAVRYVAGDATLPKAVETAFFLLVAHFFENRQEVLAADGRVQVIQIPVGAERLLDTIRLWSV